MRASRCPGFPDLRARLRVPILALLAFIGTIAIGCAWVVHILRNAERQRRAVYAIRNGGGEVWYDWEWRHGKPLQNAKPWVPQWIVRTFGDDCFGTAVCAYLTESASDSDLINLQALTRLEEVDLAETAITDAGLVHLQGLKLLRTLDLSRTSVGNAGAARLSRMANLQSLDLSDTDFGDEGMAQLAALTELRRLGLRNTAVGDAGLVHLRGLRRLQSLDVSRTSVSDRGLVHLSALKDLELLDVVFSNVTDFGVQELRRALPKANIRFLSLRRW
jgi:hypothetical protein